MISFFPRSARAQLPLCEIVDFLGFLKVVEVWSLVLVVEIGCQCFAAIEVGLEFHDALIHIFHDSIAQWMFQATGHMRSRLASPLSRQNYQRKNVVIWGVLLTVRSNKSMVLAISLWGVSKILVYMKELQGTHYS